MPNYLQVRFGAAELAFMSTSADAPLGAPLEAFGGRGVLISLRASDVDALRARLLERGLEPTPAENRPWGWRTFLVRDPDGVLLDFFEPLAEAPAPDAAG